MEKIREALRWCCNCVHAADGELCYHEDGCEPYAYGDNPIRFKNFEIKPDLEAELRVAEEALEKQKAKKVIDSKYLNSCGGYDDAKGCPVCETVYRHGKGKPKFCKDCGQKLDWSVRR